MITEQEFTLIVQKCQDLPPAKGMYLEHDFISNLFLTVLDFQMHGTTVGKAMEHYKKHLWNEIRSLDQLKGFLANYPDDKKGNTQISQCIWGNKHWLRISYLRKLVAFFESIGIRTQEALTEWARTSDFEKDFKDKIHGLSFAVYKWLVMRQGVETVKPDVHLTRFVKSIVHHDFSERELVEVLEKVAKHLGIKAYELDWKIWEYQSKR